MNGGPLSGNSLVDFDDKDKSISEEESDEKIRENRNHQNIRKGRTYKIKN